MPKDTGLEELLLASTTPPEVLTFYNGEVTLHYDAPLHAYYVVEDGQRILVPGSTTVGAMIDKSGPLTQWAANETVNAFIAEISDDDLKQEVGCYYQLLRDKQPIPDIGDKVLNIDSALLAKRLNTARFNFRSISKDATDIGTVAHEWLEGYIKAQIAGEEYAAPLPKDDPITVSSLGGRLDFAEKATNCVLAALDWFNRHKVRFWFAERKLFSRAYRYAGTTDWFGYVTACGDKDCCQHEGEELTCADFKSSRSIYEEYYIQLASYMQAWNEEYPDTPVTNRLLIRLDKDGGGVETVTRPKETFEADFDAFLGALAIYGWAKQLELDRKYEKAVVKAEKAAAKAAEAASKPKRKRRAPRKIVIKDVVPIEATSIPVGDPLPWEGPERFKTPIPPAPDFDMIPIERPM
jgi:hypothetical protein